MNAAPLLDSKTIVAGYLIVLTSVLVLASVMFGLRVHRHRPLRGRDIAELSTELGGLVLVGASPRGIGCCRAFYAGMGPHAQRDDVLYIGDGPTNRSAIYATLDTKTPMRARRHHDRANTTAAAIFRRNLS